MLKRREFLQKLINENNYHNYLEIGVFNGETFLPINCRKKTAVDPFFQISKEHKWYWKRKNFCNIYAEYHEVTSDEYFQKILNKKLKPFDLVFIDGLHTFRASLLDVLNSIRNLSNNGLVVIHDCYPPNKAAGTPASSYDNAARMNLEGWKKQWCGDVWKTIIYLKSLYGEWLEIKVLDTDFGLGVIKVIDKEKISFEILEDWFNKIDSLQYEFMKNDPVTVINLTPSRDHVAFFVGNKSIEKINTSLDEALKRGTSFVRSYFS